MLHEKYDIYSPRVCSDVHRAQKRIFFCVRENQTGAWIFNLLGLGELKPEPSEWEKKAILLPSIQHFYISSYLVFLA